MPHHHRVRARGQRRPKNRSRIDGADRVLRSDGRNVRTHDLASTVEEQTSEVLAIGQADQVMHRAGGGAPDGPRRFRSAAAGGGIGRDGHRRWGFGGGLG